MNAQSFAVTFGTILVCALAWGAIVTLLDLSPTATFAGGLIVGAGGANIGNRIANRL